jgi:hypothetical protein
MTAGCPSIPAKHQPAFTTGEHDLITHTYSHVKFPATIGAFTRDGLRNYDEAGLDVSAAYNCRSANPVVATIFSYPSPTLTSIGSPSEVVTAARMHLTEDNFEQIKEEIRRVHPSAVEIQSKSIAGPESTIGRYAEFRFNEIFLGQKQILTSKLYLFTYFDGQWTIQYRFTYPSNTNADKAVDAFVSSYSWK